MLSVVEGEAWVASLRWKAAVFKQRQTHRCAHVDTRTHKHTDTFIHGCTYACRAWTAPSGPWPPPCPAPQSCWMRSPRPTPRCCMRCVHGRVHVCVCAFMGLAARPPSNTSKTVRMQEGGRGACAWGWLRAPEQHRQGGACARRERCARAHAHTHTHTHTHTQRGRQRECVFLDGLFCVCEVQACSSAAQGFAHASVCLPV